MYVLKIIMYLLNIGFSNAVLNS